MNQSLDVWLAIAKAGRPVSSAYIRARVRSKTISQTIGHMVHSGHIKRQNIEGVAHYTAIESPARLTIQHIIDIAKANHEQ